MVPIFKVLTKKNLLSSEYIDNPAYDVVFNPQYYDVYDKPSAIRSFGHRIEEDLSAVCPQLDLIQTVSLPDDPPWTIQKLT